MGPAAGVSVNANVIITAYNYAGYVVEAVDSVLAQTYSHITRIIVVDDGSTDGTCDLLRSQYGRDKKVIVVQKSNGGQLSALNTALAHIGDCDVVFFMDADDLYDREYVQKAMAYYGQFPDCDFLFCKRRFFGAMDAVERTRYPQGLCPPSVLRTYYLRTWVGNATSMVSMRPHVLKKILPIPYESEWKVRADDCLVWGASLIGAAKYYLDEALVQYRTHDRNYHHGRTYSPQAMSQRRRSIEKLFDYIVRKNGVRVNVHERLWSEFARIHPKTLVHCVQCVRIVLHAMVRKILRGSPG